MPTSTEAPDELHRFTKEVRQDIEDAIESDVSPILIATILEERAATIRDQH